MTGIGGSLLAHLEDAPGLQPWDATHQPHHAEHRPQPIATGQRGQYSPDIYHSPASSSVSDESMNNHFENATPPESPLNADSSVSGTAAIHMRRLSIDQNSHRSTTGSPRARGMLGASTIAKRSNHPELSRPQHRRSSSSQTHAQLGRRGITSRKHGPRGFPRDSRHSTAHADALRKALSGPQHKDSGYETAPSRSNTAQYPEVDSAKFSGDIASHLDSRSGIMQLTSHSRYPGLILQPDSSPISQDQLAIEVKGIYAGLVMVEAKCINICAQQAADSKSPLSAEQWQNLIALHRTLLYEHHDFLMATQHPSATPALRGLANKYSMPARMWKHGIHAFLEVLRHRRPESQEYMLAFVYLAYQMIALLFETVPSFTDTWIECLGDLARYRMAIEEDKDANATWGGVAARWYTIASDRHPAIGRLYHHLGILERPSIRKFCLYAKSLTCVTPFQNARDSLSTLCGPLVQNDAALGNTNQSAEARAIVFHALAHSDKDTETIETVGIDALRLITVQPLKPEVGAHLAVANVAAMFQFGNTSNMLWQLYATYVMQSVRPPLSSSMDDGSADAEFDQLHIQYTHYTPSANQIATISFCYAALNAMTKKHGSVSALLDSLPFVHIMLVFFHSLHLLQGRHNEHTSAQHTFASLIDSRRVDWSGLTIFLNTLMIQHPIGARILECARQGVFLISERKEDARPLSEDYLIRGLIWTQELFPPGWFDGQTEDDGRAIETPTMQKARAERVLWLGIYLAFHTGFIFYDVQKKVFSTSATSAPVSMAAAQPSMVEMDATDSCSEHLASAESMRPASPSSDRRSASSRSEDGYDIVKHPDQTDQNDPTTSSVESAQTMQSSSSYVYVAKPARTQQKPTKARPQSREIAFREGEDDGMAWTPDGQGDEASEDRRLPIINDIRHQHVQ